MSQECEQLVRVNTHACVISCIHIYTYLHQRTCTLIHMCTRQGRPQRQMEEDAIFDAFKQGHPRHPWTRAGVHVCRLVPLLSLHEYILICTKGVWKSRPPGITDFTRISVRAWSAVGLISTMRGHRRPERTMLRHCRRVVHWRQAQHPVVNPPLQPPAPGPGTLRGTDAHCRPPRAPPCNGPPGCAHAMPRSIPASIPTSVSTSVST